MISADGLVDDALIALSREPHRTRTERSNLTG
jgi:hypothetical protein